MSPPRPGRVGYVCRYAPVPLIHASGRVPYRILPLGDPPDGAGSVLHDNLCPHVKVVLSRALDGDLPPLDGVVMMNSCDAMRRLADAWARVRPDDRLVVVDLPLGSGDHDVAYFTSELERLEATLESWTGSEIQDHGIARSTQLYRDLALEIEGLADSAPRARIQELSNRAVTRPPEDVLAELQANQALPEPTKDPARGVPVLLFGNVLPEPAFLVATSTPCSGGVALLEEMARHFRRPLFVIHIPHRNDEAAVRHLACQLERLVDFVSENRGRKLHPLELREAIELSNEARALLAETYELASAVPTPARRRDLINFGIVISLCFGTREGVEVARAYRDEFARKVERGIGGLPGERHRLLWIQNRIQFRSPVEELLESEHGAAVVADELNAVTWDPIDPDDPFPGLARRMLASPFTGGIAGRIAGVQRMARQYRVDGAINPCHWGCRQGTGARGLMAAGLREIDIPVLNLEIDCVDQRNFSEGQVRTRLQAFMEMLGERQPEGRAH